MPFMNCDLGYLACATPTYSLSLEDIQFIMYRIISALCYLHSAEIVHRDINTTAILVSWEEGENSSKKILNAVLSSLGQARSLSPPYGLIIEESITVNNTNSKPTGTGLGLWGLGFNPTLSPIANDIPLRPPTHIGTKQQSTFDKLLRPKYNLIYWAPELAILQERGFTVKNFDWKKCDIWSLGCVLAEILRGGEPLFTSRTSKNLIGEILRIKELHPKNTEYLHSDCLSAFSSTEDPIYSLKEMTKYVPPTKLSSSLNQKPILNITQHPELSEKCIDLLIQMLSFDPEERPSCEDLLQHEFFQGITKYSPSENVCTFGDSLTDINLVEFVISKCRGQ